MRHDRRNVRAVTATDPVHLFDQLPVAFDNPRIERMLFDEPLEIFQRHADVEIVCARGDDVLAGTRRLAGDRGIDVEIEEHRPQARELGVERLAGLQRKAGASLRGGVRGSSQRRRGAGRTNLREVRLL